MLDLCQHIRFPHIHQSIVQMALGFRQCTEQGKNLKPVKGKQPSFNMEPAVGLNEEVQLGFAGPLPDEINQDTYLLIAIDK